MKFSKNRIFLKVFKTVFISIMFFTSVFSVYSVSNQKSEILKSLSLEARSMANMLIYVSSDAIVLNDGSYLVEFNHEFLLKSDLVESILISRNNNKYYQIKKDGWIYEENMNPIYKNEEKKHESFVILNSPVLNKEVFHYTTPVEFSGTNWGYLHLSISLDGYYKKIQAMYISFLSFFIILFLVSIFISYVVASNFSKPIITINKTANKISQGNLNLRSEYKSDDEIGELSDSFNKMISTIESSQKELKESYDKLEERVKERTLELNETNKQLEFKTLELENLNKNLDNKVKQEVEKRSKQEALLVQQSRLAAMGEMMGNIAHQWRQPLSAITTAASGMKLEKEFGLSEEEKEVEKLDFIVNNSNYLSKTIDDFSNFFKPNKIKQVFSIEEKLEDAISLVGASFSFYYIDVIRKFEPVEKIYGLPNEYSQAVMNILSNAKDVIKERKIEEPLITLRVFKEDDYGVLEVEDNAGGIEKSIISKIFDPYFTTKHQYQGTGIGLYMSKMIIEQNMSGKLEARNSSSGAIFKISIPIYLDEGTK